MNKAVTTSIVVIVVLALIALAVIYAPNIMQIMVPQHVRPPH